MKYIWITVSIFIICITVYNIFEMKLNHDQECKIESKLENTGEYNVRKTSI